MKIVTDSTSDVPPALAAALGITIVPQQVAIGDQIYQDGIDLTGEEFYRLLHHTSAVPRTSQPALGRLEDAYRTLTADGFDVASVHVSSGLSGTYNVACLAAEAEGLGPGTITVVDSQAVSMCLGWIAIYAARAAEAGAPLPEVVALVEEMRGRVRILAALDTLEYVQRSGRLGVASAFLGTMLAIKPILHMKQGTVQPLEKVRTMPRALQRVVELTAAMGPLEALAVIDGDAAAEARHLADMLAPVYPRDKMLLNHTGAGVGVHVGPRAVGVCALLAK